MGTKIKMTTLPFEKRVELALSLKMTNPAIVLREMSKVPDSYIRSYTDRLMGYAIACIGQAKVYTLIPNLFGTSFDYTLDYTTLSPAQSWVLLVRIAACIPYFEPELKSLAKFLADKLGFDKRHVRLIESLAKHYVSAK